MRPGPRPTQPECGPEDSPDEHRGTLLSSCHLQESLAHGPQGSPRRLQAEGASRLMGRRAEPGPAVSAPPCPARLALGRQGQLRS